MFYQQSSIPFTLPAVLVDNVVAALQAYPERYGQLQQRFNFFQQVFKNPLKEVKASGGCHGIGKEFAKDVSLKSSHPCDNG
ncbi:hypothetical protein ACFTQ7_06765 [Lysinibacillus sp. NPDC056959]|uniref:hypothetical protein n=1 Tax=Lysinibacillus sp. NPDC056959 TaxID=3345981 RepID=UPI003630FBD8